MEDPLTVSLQTKLSRMKKAVQKKAMAEPALWRTTRVLSRPCRHLSAGVGGGGGWEASGADRGEVRGFAPAGFGSHDGVLGGGGALSGARGGVFIGARGARESGFGGIVLLRIVGERRLLARGQTTSLEVDAEGYRGSERYHVGIIVPTHLSDSVLEAP
jgi:hypothetical protein